MTSDERTVRAQRYTPTLRVVGDKAEMVLVADDSGAWMHYDDADELRRAMATLRARYEWEEKRHHRYRKRWQEAKKRIKELEASLPTAPTVEAEVQP